MRLPPRPTLPGLQAVVGVGGGPQPGPLTPREELQPEACRERLPSPSLAQWHLQLEREERGRQFGALTPLPLKAFADAGRGEGGSGKEEVDVLQK